jgi:branched-chain amino acid aminotransferase
MLEAWRPGSEKVLAFYEHRLGAICRDPRVMAMPMDDHLVHRGDGVFETLKWVDGKIYQLDAHMRRLEKCAKAIYMSPPCTYPEIRELVLEVARTSESEEGMVRVLFGRGPGGFAIDPFECPVTSLYVIAYRFKPVSQEKYESGATAFRTRYPAKQEYMATLKSINYLPNSLMKREAVEKGYDYPLCFDEKGFLAEGATENVLMVDSEGRLVVPELSNALRGTTLLRALELIQPEMNHVYRKISEDEIYEARELIVLGTTVDAIGIVRYNGKPIHDVRPGPVSTRMRELLRRDMREKGFPIRD